MQISQMQISKAELLAEKIWDFCNFRTELVRSDVILVLCSHDIRIAKYAAELFHQGLAPRLVFSGGLSAFTSKIYPVSEAQAFAEAAMAHGVPAESILIEDKSTNTQENLEFTYQLLNELGQSPSKTMLVQKPNMLRRVYATATKLFPELSFSITSHDISFAEAHHDYLAREMLIHELTGDLQRIAVYAERGLMSSQEIDPIVWQAFLDLKDLGYTGNLVS